MPKITPFLWFDDQAEEAANFYVSVFSSRRGADSDPGPSKVTEITRYGEAGPGTQGTVMTASFQLAGQEFTALNGGKQPFTFNESVSRSSSCQSRWLPTWDSRRKPITRSRASSTSCATSAPASEPRS